MSANEEINAQPVRVDTGLNRAFKLTLPSLGIPYGDKIPGGVIDVRPMTTAEEAILYSASGDGVSKIGAIISACLVTKAVAPEDLLLTDRFYILLLLRSRSFGARYEFPLRCQGCSQQSKTSINLAEDLKVTRMDPSVTEPFEVPLPVSGDTVSLRFLRGKDEIRIAKYAKRVRMQSSDPSDPSYLYRLALQIVAINGKEVTLADAESYVRKLDIGDSSAMRLATEKNEAGVDTTIYVDCGQCGYTNELEMPFTVEFFRPSR
jgi:hypothetical protein